MRQVSFYIAFLGIIALLMGGCESSNGGDGGKIAAAADPVASPKPNQPQPLATPPALPNQPGKTPAASGLIQPTNPEVYVQQVPKGRSDPFGVVLVQPTKVTVLPSTTPAPASSTPTASPTNTPAPANSPPTQRPISSQTNEQKVDTARKQSQQAKGNTSPQPQTVPSASGNGSQPSASADGGTAAPSKKTTVASSKSQTKTTSTAISKSQTKKTTVTISKAQTKKTTVTISKSRTKPSRVAPGKPPILQGLGSRPGAIRVAHLGSWLMVSTVAPPQAQPKQNRVGNRKSPPKATAAAQMGFQIGAPIASPSTSPPKRTTVARPATPARATTVARPATPARVTTAARLGSQLGTPGAGGSGSVPAVSPPPLFEPLLPNLPEPELARSVEVTGVIQVDNLTQAILKVPTEPATRYVQAGQLLSNGQVLVKRIEMNQGSSPVVVLEQYGIEVNRKVGENQPQTPAAGGTGR